MFLKLFQLQFTAVDRFDALLFYEHFITKFLYCWLIKF